MEAKLVGSLSDADSLSQGQCLLGNGGCGFVSLGLLVLPWFTSCSVSLNGVSTGAVARSY